MDKQRVTLFLTPGLVQKAKHQALKGGVSLSQLVDKLFEKYLPSVMVINETGDKDKMKITFVKNTNFKQTKIK